jgi:alkanesulfonate monooxygenase SsuD/methylene tetrahydromethanopterin reductase-like flavin-dependent oxidoreductase (luciferase family)
MLEAYSTLGYLAGVTQRISVGTLVGCALYREPGLLLKAATSVDVLSGGRLYLGIGAGWYEREARGLGLPFPSRRERFTRLEETLRILTGGLSGDRSPFVGEHYRLDEPIIVPLPLSRPRPPIMVGGNGEWITLRLVAQYADACNLLVPTPDEARHLFAVLRRHCTHLGRDYDAIERTSLNEVDLRPGAMSPEDVLYLADAMAAAGVQHLIVNMPEVHDPRHIETFAEQIIPRVRDVEPAA